jgi:branched-chain amino acid aminotransferase
VSRVASVDGKITSLEGAVIPVTDRGFLYADGVFETLRAYGGRLFAREEHLARLARSASALRIALPLSLTDLSRELDAAMEAAQESEAYVRIMMTRGAAPEPSLVPGDDLRATRVILVQAVRPPAAAVYARGLSAITLAWSRGVEGGPAAAVKMLSYTTSILALDEAGARGADDAIFLGSDGGVRDASTSNVFLVDGAGRLVTPLEQPGVLGGITRGHVLDLASSLGITCAAECVPRTSLACAREIFLTSSIREIASVVRVDGAVIGDGVPGPTARALHRALRQRAGASGALPWE